METNIILVWGFVAFLIWGLLLCAVTIAGNAFYRRYHREA